MSLKTLAALWALSYLHPANAFGTSSIVARDNASTIVDLGYARYEGTFNSTSNMTSYLAVRYADPPTGECFSLSK